ncbi:MAG: hypothetical protein M9892_04610 [Bacteroidetes bacterium]|nr:hypothetical protein [Bacteroidota bacterium]
MAQEIVNQFGRLTGWNRITLNLLGRDVEGIRKIAYDDTVEKENAYGASRMPIGREEKNYAATCSLELYSEEVRAIQRSLPIGQRIQDIAPFDVVVEYELPDGTLYKDRVKNCEFTNNSREVNQGDGSIVTEYTLICSHVQWNVI